MTTGRSNPVKTLTTDFTGGPRGPVRVSSFAMIAVALAIAVCCAIYLLHRVDMEAHPYFPDRMLEDRDGKQRPRLDNGQLIVDLYQEQQLSGLWRRLDEPSLYLQSRSSGEIRQTIRFTLEPSFYSTVVVRIDWLSSGEVRLTAKTDQRPSWSGSAEGKHLVRDLSAEEQRELAEVMASTGAFSGPDERLLVGPDGSNWLFESASSGQYHYEAEWVAQGPRKEAGQFMMKLTGWDLP